MSSRITTAIVSALLAFVLPVASVRADDDASERIVDRIMVQLHADEANEAEALASFIAALESHPDFPGLTAEVLDGIPSRRIYLIALEAPAGVDLGDLELDETFDPWLDEGEPVFEREAPEGTTGSTWIDGIGIDHAAYGAQYIDAQLGLTAAQQRARGAGVAVAILDTGIDGAHPLLASAMCAGGYDFIDGDADPTDSANGTDDDGDGLIDEACGHGTFVAGLVHRVAPDAGIVPIRVLDDDGNGTSWSLVAGVCHAIDRGVEVINLSLRSTAESSLLDEVLDEARDRGIVVVAAAGNLNRSTPRVWPAMADKALGVAAVDELDRKASFSNFHTALFVSAPGVSAPAGEGGGAPDPARSIISTVPGGTYAVWDGTSMAAPLVTGAAALIRSQHVTLLSHSDTVDFVRDEIAASAVAIDAINPEWAGQLGVGRLDVAAALLRHPVAPPLGDLDGDGVIGFPDLMIVLGAWGDVHSNADLDASGSVDFTDLLFVLGRL